MHSEGIAQMGIETSMPWWQLVDMLLWMRMRLSCHGGWSIRDTLVLLVDYDLSTYAHQHQLTLWPSG